MTSNSINNWLKAVKVVLWISLIGFGLTLINTTGLIFTSSDMFATVKLKKSETIILDNGQLKANGGIFSFKSTNVIDRLIFKHVYGYHDFVQSLFTFITCFILLLTVNKVDSSSPFNLIIAKRICLIGVIYILYGLISIGAGFYIVSRIEAITNQLTGNYSNFRDDLSNIKVGIFILIFSLIYRVGVTFQEENRLTV